MPLADSNKRFVIELRKQFYTESSGRENSSDKRSSIRDWVKTGHMEYVKAMRNFSNNILLPCSVSFHRWVNTPSEHKSNNFDPNSVEYKALQDEAMRCDARREPVFAYNANTVHQQMLGRVSRNGLPLRFNTHPLLAIPYVHMTAEQRNVYDATYERYRQQLRTRPAFSTLTLDSFTSPE